MSSTPASDAASVATVQLDSDRRLTTLMLLLTTLPSLWFVSTDLALFRNDPAGLTARLTVRLLAVSVTVIALWRLRSVATRAAYSGIVFGAALALTFSVWVIVAYRPAGSGLPLRGPMFFLIAMYAAMPNTFWRQILPPMALAVGIMVIDAVKLRVPGAGFGDDLVLLGILNVAGVLVVRQRLALESAVAITWEEEQSARTAEARTRAELGTLRGIVPICAHCRCVRTEIGEWQLLERYVRDHSEAQFARGLCPNCTQLDDRDLDRAAPRN